MKHFWLKLILLIMAINTAVAFSSNISEDIQVYQRNVHLSPEHKQKIAAAINRYHHADNLWDTLREEFTLPHYENNERVQQQIEWFMNNQDFLYRSAARAAPYLYYIFQQLKIRHLPAEIALLPIFESSFNPFASSPVGAAGIWQMMPGTASGYGIKRTWWYDGRRDVVASTKAALNYLAYLGDFFDGNWLYAIAAYDTGEGNLLSAIKKNIRNGDTTDYWSLPVAQETQDYIPKLMALAIIISHPEKYPVELPYVSNAPYLAQIDVGTQIDLKHAAYLAGLTFEKMKHLNPGYSHAATDPNGPYKLVLPIENVERFAKNLASTSPYQPKYNSRYYKPKSNNHIKMIARKVNNKLHVIHPHTVPTAAPETSMVAVNEPILPPQGHYTMQPGDTLYMVRKGDDVEKIAHRFHIAARNISISNHLNSMHLRPGQQLIIPTHLAANTKKTEMNPGNTLYMVRKGDSVEKIASKYHITPAALRLANLMSSNEIHEGEQIIVPT